MLNNPTLLYEVLAIATTRNAHVCPLLLSANKRVHIILVLRGHYNHASFILPNSSTKLSRVCIFLTAMTLITVAIELVVSLMSTGRVYQARTLRDISPSQECHKTKTLIMSIQLGY
jgi:hypothetical protein